MSTRRLKAVSIGGGTGQPRLLSLIHILAKADEEVFVPWDDTPIVLPSGCLLYTSRCV